MWGLLVVGGVGFGLCDAAVALVVKSGVIENHNGITAKGAFTTVYFEWSTISGFNHARAGSRDLVFVTLKDGRTRRLPNVLQGQRVVWEDGQTDDILGVLSEQLAIARQRRVRS